MRILTSLDHLAVHLREGRLTHSGSRGVVMTMGALHEGHVALVRAAREQCDEVIVTIFVNPLQFNDAADLERYPRDIEADAALLEPLGVDVLFAPAGADVYPDGEPVVTVASGRLGEIFEGASRPGHFDGMLTVVLKLLHLTRPDVAFFGEKDAQQLIAVRRMVRDLNLGVEIVGVPTVRDADGLALSSRNAQLSAAVRAEALALPRALHAVEREVAAGAALAAALDAGHAVLAEAPTVVVEYLAALDPATAEDAGGAAASADARDAREVIIAGAIRVGATRLIDNVRLNPAR